MTETPSDTNVEVERLMRAIEDEVRRERRQRLLARGGPTAYHDPDVYGLVERAVRRAIDRSDADRQLLMIPDLLGDERTWRPQTHLRFSSHRAGVGGLIVGIKRRVLFPVMRWLFEWANENFRRQDYVNRVLFASIEELAIENARLRAELDGRPDPSH